MNEEWSSQAWKPAEYHKSEVIDFEHPVSIIKLVVPAEHLGEVVNPECKWSLRDDVNVDVVDVMVGCTEFSVECWLWHGKTSTEHHLPACDAEAIPPEQDVEQKYLMIALLTGTICTDKELKHKFV